MEETQDDLPEDRQSMRAMLLAIAAFPPDYHHTYTYDQVTQQRMSDLFSVQLEPIALSSGQTLHVRLGALHFGKPCKVEMDGRVEPMTPRLARVRGEGYSCRLTVDVHEFRTTTSGLSEDVARLGFGRCLPDAVGEGGPEAGDAEAEAELVPGVTHRVHRAVDLAQWPVMVGSYLCRLSGVPREQLIRMGEYIDEMGGYFISEKGKERVLVPQKDMAKNMVFLSADGDASFKARVHGAARLPYAAQYFYPQHVVNVVTGQYSAAENDVVFTVTVNTYSVLPLGVVLAALGATNAEAFPCLSDATGDGRDWWDRNVVGLVAALGRLPEQVVRKGLQATHNQLLAGLGCDGESGEVVCRLAWAWLTQTLARPRRAGAEVPEFVPGELAEHGHAFQLLQRNLFPHVEELLPPVTTPDETWAVARVKVAVLCDVVAGMLRLREKLDEPTDRDHTAARRYEPSGELVLQLFHAYLRPQLSDFHKALVKMDAEDKEVDVRTAMLGSQRLSKGLQTGLQSGRFQPTKRGGRSQPATNDESTGISQSLTRLNQSAMVSHLRKVATPSSRKTPPKARQLHTSQWGFLCPYETPEGAGCGNVNHLAKLAVISITRAHAPIQRWLERNVPGYAPVYDLGFDPREWVVVLDERVVASFRPAGLERERPRWLGEFRAARARGELAYDVGIGVPRPELRRVYIRCDAGRLLRPLCVVRAGRLLLTARDVAEARDAEDFRAWMRAGKVEFVDAAESEDLFVAMFYSDLRRHDARDYTHCELCPATCLGYSASLIPDCHRNQSPRNVYQCVWEETPVLMADGSRRALKDVRVGDRVRCFDPETLAVCNSEVTFSGTWETDKRIVSVWTESLRTIALTEDHRVMTARGWVQAGSLQPGDLVAVGYAPRPPAYEPRCSRLNILARLYGRQLGLGNVVSVTHDVRERELLGDLRHLGHIGTCEIHQMLRLMRPSRDVIRDSALDERDPACAVLAVWLSDETAERVCEFLAGLWGAAGIPTDQPWMRCPPRMRLDGWRPAGAEMLVRLLRDVDVNAHVEPTATGCDVVLERDCTNLVHWFTTVGVRYNAELAAGYAREAEALQIAEHPSRARDPNARGQDRTTRDQDWAASAQDRRVDAATGQLGLRGDALFVPVREVHTFPRVRVGDLTVRDHSCFIAGDGFFVHNSGMGKQTFGTPHIPIAGSTKPTVHALASPEFPLVTTAVNQAPTLPFSTMPCGQNVRLAIMSYGSNVEDSLILNRQSVERGLFASFTDRCYLQTARRNTNHVTLEGETFERPDPATTERYKTMARYDHLDEDGLPPPGTLITSNTVVIGKTGPLPTPPDDETKRDRSIDRSHMFANPQHVCRDLSTMPRKNGSGVVVSSELCQSGESIRASVTVRIHRKPRVGDKFSSRHGQKGICALLADSDDLPCTTDGKVPDIIMNAHAFPSRMTIGQPFEGMLGNVAAHQGVQRDATAFFSPSIHELGDELEALGLSRKNDAVMVCPFTGEPMQARIYVGYVYYQALKHLVEEKIHARARGPVTKSNRQPVEGRRKDGGLRVGEMEAVNLVGHGVAHFTQERMMLMSDKFDVPVCTQCGNFASRDPAQFNSLFCPHCESRNTVKMETLPYPMKQFKHYLAAIGIDLCLEYRALDAPQLDTE